VHKGEIKNENGRILNKKRRWGGIAIFLETTLLFSTYVV
jgi:hypothetical protein